MSFKDAANITLMLLATPPNIDQGNDPWRFLSKIFSVILKSPWKRRIVVTHWLICYRIERRIIL